MSTDLSLAIAPKSDQLNADDLIAGPLEITITRVSISPGEQPISIDYQGGDGRPWKPCKSMARVLVLCWGADGKAYAGRRARLYRDPEVRFGPAQVGGIRISHLSHIDAERSIALTTARGRRIPYLVRALPAAQMRPDATPPGGRGGPPGVVRPAGETATTALDPDHPQRLDLPADADQAGVKAAGAALRACIERASSYGLAVTWWELNEEAFRERSPALANWIEQVIPDAPARLIETR